MELSIQQHILKSPSIELLALKKIVGDGAISQVFDKVVHPTQLMVGLLDIFGFFDAWDLRVFDIGSVEGVIH